MVEEANEILVCVACGTEDIELTAPVDILRRAGAICILAKVPSLDDTDKESLLITCANKTKIVLIYIYIYMPLPYIILFRYVMSIYLEFWRTNTNAL